MTLPYHTLPPAPAEVDGPGVLARLVDGMGFRYRWATEGLESASLAFRPCEGAMTMGEVLAHMNVLVRWVESTLRGALEDTSGEFVAGGLRPPEAWEDLQRDTLSRLVDLRALLAGADPARLAEVTITSPRRKVAQPFWSIINGPLADFLTHVGQIASWRRMLDDPVPQVDVFQGTPPPD